MKDSLMGALSLSGFFMVRSTQKGIFFVPVVFVCVPERLLISAMHVFPSHVWTHAASKSGWLECSPWIRTHATWLPRWRHTQIKSTHANYMAFWQFSSVIQSKDHLGLTWNISTHFKWLTIKLCTDSRGPQRMNPNDLMMPCLCL